MRKERQRGGSSHLSPVAAVCTTQRPWWGRRVKRTCIPPGVRASPEGGHLRSGMHSHNIRGWAEIAAGGSAGGESRRTLGASPVSPRAHRSAAVLARRETERDCAGGAGRSGASSWRGGTEGKTNRNALCIEGHSAPSSSVRRPAAMECWPHHGKVASHLPVAHLEPPAPRPFPLLPATSSSGCHAVRARNSLERARKPCRLECVRGGGGTGAGAEIDTNCFPNTVDWSRPCPSVRSDTGQAGKKADSHPRRCATTDRAARPRQRHNSETESWLCWGDPRHSTGFGRADRGMNGACQPLERSGRLAGISNPTRTERATAESSTTGPTPRTLAGCQACQQRGLPARTGQAAPILDPVADKRSAGELCPSWGIRQPSIHPSHAARTDRARPRAVLAIVAKNLRAAIGRCGGDTLDGDHDCDWRVNAWLGGVRSVSCYIDSHRTPPSSNARPSPPPRPRRCCAHAETEAGRRSSPSFGSVRQPGHCSRENRRGSSQRRTVSRQEMNRRQPAAGDGGGSTTRGCRHNTQIGRRQPACDGWLCKSCWDGAPVRGGVHTVRDCKTTAWAFPPTYIGAFASG